jgi:hypothetical protein
VTSFSTADLPDSVVNQRAFIGVYATAEGDRGGALAVSVSLDGDRGAGIPFTAPADSFRGWSGVGLGPEDCRYVSGILYSAALLFVEAAERNGAA